MVENPIKNKATFEKANVNNCCYFFTLRSGTLCIGISLAITGLLWVIGGATGGGSAYSGFFSGLLLLASGALIVWAFKKENVDFLWYSVYMLIGIFLWMVLSAIIIIFTFKVVVGIISLINAALVLYFALVVRSYAFELADGPTTTTTTTTTPTTNPA